MPSLKQRVQGRVEAIRARLPLIDHGVRMVQHHGAVKGSLQAGAVTYFAFLSIFPILALAFAVIGYVAKVYPDAQQDLLDAIETVLPGMVGPEEGQISLDTLQSNAPGIFSIGLLVVLYSGLGWLSAMREALLVVFETPRRDQPNLITGKLRDLVALVSLGLVLFLAVGASGVVTSLSGDILEALDLGADLDWVLWLLALAVGLLANMLLFYAFFTLLGSADDPKSSLWSGALLGAIGFELLKQASRWLLESTAEQPAFQAFGIALILVVWINYFSRVVMYAAAWAHTSAGARALRAEAQQAHAVKDASSPALAAGTPPAGAQGDSKAAFIAGGASMLALMALVRRMVRKDQS